MKFNYFVCVNVYKPYTSIIQERFILLREITKRIDSYRFCRICPTPGMYSIPGVHLICLSLFIRKIVEGITGKVRYVLRFMLDYALYIYTLHKTLT